MEEGRCGDRCGAGVGSMEEAASGVRRARPSLIETAVAVKKFEWTSPPAQSQRERLPGHPLRPAQLNADKPHLCQLSRFVAALGDEAVDQPLSVAVARGSRSSCGGVATVEPPPPESCSGKDRYVPPASRRYSPLTTRVHGRDGGRSRGITDEHEHQRLEPRPSAGRGRGQRFLPLPVFADPVHPAQDRLRRGETPRRLHRGPVEDLDDRHRGTLRAV